MSKTAIITGATGQDASYLMEFLLDKGYNVVGTVRRSSTDNFNRIRHILDKIEIEYSDLCDSYSIDRLIKKYRPDEFYNLAAQSFVKVSFENPLSTSDATALGSLRILEAIRNNDKNIRFYQASSSEMFGKVQEMPQSEVTPFYPRSPYGVSKLYAHWMTVNYRESYDMYCCSGILFNHESPRRGLEFVTRKISNAVARIKLGLQDKLYLGNLDASRDWGSAKDYVEAMWLMLQQDKPDDYVIATGETHTVRDFVDIAFRHVGLDYNDYVVVDPKFYRPAEVDVLLGDPTKARNCLGWNNNMCFNDLVRWMVDSDLRYNNNLSKIP